MSDWEPDCVCGHQSQTHDSRRGGCQHFSCHCPQYQSEQKPSRSIKTTVETMDAVLPRHRDLQESRIIRCPVDGLQIHTRTPSQNWTCDSCGHVVDVFKVRPNNELGG